MTFVATSQLNNIEGGGTGRLIELQNILLWNEVIVEYTGQHRLGEQVTLYQTQYLLTSLIYLCTYYFILISFTRKLLPLIVRNGILILWTYQTDRQINFCILH